MKNGESRKLTLNKETIRRLSQHDLNKVVGGTAAPCTSGDPRCTCPSFIGDTDGCTGACACTSGNPACTCPSYVGDSDAC